MNKKLITTYEIMDAKKEDPFARLIILKSNMKVLLEILEDVFQESNYEPAKYLAMMEIATDCGFVDLANDIKDYVKKYSPGVWLDYTNSKKSDHSGATDQDNR